MNSPRSAPFVLSVGTQIVSLIQVLGPQQKLMHPRGAVGVVVFLPVDEDHAYRVRFPDGYEVAMHRRDMVPLAHFKQGWLDETGTVLQQYDLYDRVIYRCIIGSRAYGLEGEGSDTDRRGIYLPPADLHWSLYGVPEQLENHATQEAYWELQKFITMALKANPNVIECLYTPLVETATPLARELLAIRDCFLSQMVYQTFNGYVLSQFKKIQVDIRNQGRVKWKHVMHLIRLLLMGIRILQEGVVQVRVDQFREELLAIKRVERNWDDIDHWRLALHQQFDVAAKHTSLPERPDYEQANAFLVRARRQALEGGLP